MDEKRIAEIRETIKKAHAMVSALCKPRGTEGARSWLMSIPAQPEYDPDLVIDGALRGADYLLQALTAAQKRAEKAEAEVSTLKHEAKINTASFVVECPPDVWDESCGTKHVAVRILAARAEAAEKSADRNAADSALMADISEVVLGYREGRAEELLSVIKKLAEAEEWIRVETSLPEDGDSAIIFVPGLEDAYLRNRVAWIDYDGVPPQWIHAGVDVENVTHWRPLPAPPALEEKAQ